ncbi:hypothetical protein BKA67DRAFT_577752 [Truncatella angustata]|uniref:DUF7730 domain-containing protein n=1 Tax=Truncatella angustata TaxID=152316 RepID=A0A9P8RPV5_9PEZI|nr:uncharacterized protein BKA67DRAFT_577752 [Truncatella angustata]KAH6647522.1 hypothetical protein BKA67DRAFT_577752 [Truncatella angustata]
MSTLNETQTGEMPLAWPRHDATIDVHSQKQSLLFRLPPEIRRMVYSCALAEVEVPGGRFVKRIGDEDFEDTSLESSTNVRGHWALYDMDVPPWIRPGCTSRMTIPLDLLCTCKRICNETHRLLHRIKTHKFYVFHGPHRGSANEKSRDRALCFVPPTGANVVNLHVFAQSLSLEAGRHDCLRAEHLSSIASSLEDLTITIRPLYNRVSSQQMTHFNQSLSVTPYMPRTSMSDMTQTQMVTADSKDLESLTEGWPSIFSGFPNLRRFTMEFDHHEGRRASLESLALGARKWRFPMAGGMELVNKSPASISPWRGLRVHDYFICITCRNLRPHPQSSCVRCGWRIKGKGPRMFTYRVDWVARKKGV